MKAISLCIKLSSIIVFGIQRVSTSSNQLETNDKKQLQAWDMMLAFGELYKAKGWVLHYDQSHNSTTSWKRLYQTMLKESKNVGGILQLMTFLMKLPMLHGG